MLQVIEKSRVHCQRNKENVKQIFHISAFLTYRCSIIRLLEVLL